MTYNFYIRSAEGDPRPLIASNHPMVLTAVIDALIDVLEQVRAEVNSAEARDQWLRILRDLEEEEPS